MAIQSINLGTPNQGNGDTLRDAFLKVNSNFAEMSATPRIPVYEEVPTSVTPQEGELAIALNPTGAEWPALATGSHLVVYVGGAWTSLSTF